MTWVPRLALSISGKWERVRREKGGRRRSKREEEAAVRRIWEREGGWKMEEMREEGWRRQRRVWRREERGGWRSREEEAGEKINWFFVGMLDGSQNVVILMTGIGV